jgi:hypothetical protein
MRNGRAAQFFGFGLMLTLACGGGGGTDAAATKPAEAKTQYRCGLQVSKKTSGQYSGKGSDADAAKADELAWADACAKVPEAERATCHDETKWQVTKSSMSASGGGPVTHSTSIQLVAIAPAFDGDGQSDVSSEEACKAALEVACAKAGAPGDCLAAGYEKKGESRSKTRSMK